MPAEALAVEPQAPQDQHPRNKGFFGEPGAPDPSQNGLKSGAIRRANRHRLAAIDKMAEQVIPALERLVSGSNPTPERAAALKTIESHLARIDSYLSKAKKASDFRDLAQARSKLFEQWAHLAGIPRPIDQPGRNRRTQATIILPTPEPEPGPAPAQLPPPSESQS